MKNVIDIRWLLTHRRNLRALTSWKAQRIREEARLRRLRQGPPRPPVTLGGSFLSDNPDRRKK